MSERVGFNAVDRLSNGSAASTHRLKFDSFIEMNW